MKRYDELARTQVALKEALESRTGLDARDRQQIRKMMVKIASVMNILINTEKK